MSRPTLQRCALLATALMLLSACQGLLRAPATSPELALVMRLDEAVFEKGYNRCDMAALAAVVSERVAFYHDQHGILSSKPAFLGAIENGICKLEYKARRELVPGSMEVHPLRRDGVLYGLVQHGEHRFYARHPNQDEHLTSIGRFTILWLLEGGEWKMAQALSYDHRSP